MSLNTSAHVCTANKSPQAYIAGLPAWDGVPRLDTWLPHVLDATPHRVGMYHMEYLGLVGRYWLLGMTHRALKPGCRFDAMPVLTGPPGTGKSRLLEVLSGADRFSDEAFDMVWRKTSAEQLQSVWIYEIAELSAFSKSDKRLIKAYVSAHGDAYRQPDTTETHICPRQFVVVGTSNTSKFLTDDDRRYWPVPVQRAINIQWTHTFRDQLFAEAKSRIEEAFNTPDLNVHPGRNFSPAPAGHLHPSACLPLTGVVMPWVTGDNYILLYDSQRRVRYSGIRHCCFDPSPTGVWQIIESRYDATDTRWDRNFQAVTDDFGWLVEVPSC